MVSNQNIAIEMFLLRLMYLKKINIQNNTKKKIDTTEKNIINNDNLTLTVEDNSSNFKNKTISQIKNVYQPKNENKLNDEAIQIKGFNDLINICNVKKEIKLKYELENNVNLVNFEKERIEISFNENLDKNFVKNISAKLFQWTNKRWIITFSKKVGLPSKKQIANEEREDLLAKANQSLEYKKIMEIFPDAKLIEIEVDKKKND